MLDLLDLYTDVLERSKVLLAMTDYRELCTLAGSILILARDVAEP